MKKYYKISEDELIDLISEYFYATCLDQAGVDNWSNYMINKKDFLGDFSSFREKAKNELKYYVEIEG